MNENPIPWESVSPELEPDLQDRIQRQLDAGRHRHRSPSIHSAQRPNPTTDDDTTTPPTAKSYSKKLKYQVTLEAIRETLTQREISLRYKVPQPLVSRWKSIGLEAIEDAISSSRGRRHTITKQAFTALEKAIATSDQSRLENLCQTLKSATAMLEEMTRESNSKAEVGSLQE